MAGSPPMRTQRVSALVREVISELLRFEVKDPRVASITLTEVEVTGDLREARIYYSAPEDPAARKAIVDGLARASGFLRRELGRRVRLRSTPALDFRLDTSIEYGDRIERRLAELGLSTSSGEAAADGAGDDEPGDD